MRLIHYSLGVTLIRDSRTPSTRLLDFEDGEGFGFIFPTMKWGLSSHLHLIHAQLLVCLQAALP